MIKDDKIYRDPEVLFGFADMFYRLTKFHLQYDHHFSALNSYITAQYLLYMAKEINSQCKQSIKVPVLPLEFIEMLKEHALRR